MAAARSLPIFRARITTPPAAETRRLLARLFIIPKRDSSSSSSSSSSSIDSPLFQKLLKAPLSRFKSTLDSESSYDSTEFPWRLLLSSLNSYSPEKANLVIEWKLEKLTGAGSKNLDSYVRLISLCENISNLPVALFVFASMESQGVKPTPHVFNALISTSLSSGNFLTSLSLFEIMKRSEDYKPDSDTFDAFISAYANSGNKNATESWLNAKKDFGFPSDARTYGFLIQCCVKSKAFEDAQSYFEEMMLAGLMPNESIFQNLLMMYCHQRNVGKVKEMLKLLRNGKWRVDGNVARRVVAFYQELGLVEELIDVFTESNQCKEILSICHCSLIRHHANNNRLDDVEYTVGRMIKRGITFSIEEDVEKVICCYFRNEAYDRLDLFLERIRGYYKPTRSIYDLLSAGYRRAGLLEKLNLLGNEMKLAGFA